MEAETTFNFLWKAAKSIVAENHTKKLIKSYYLSRCYNLAEKSLQLPKDYFAKSQMCTHCFMPWIENDFHINLISGKATNNAKTKKLISKLEDHRGTLSRKQKNRAKWLKRKLKTYIEITCKHCGHKMQVQLEKPKKKSNILKSVEVKEQVTITPKNKKNKKKNKTAGLKIVIPAQTKANIMAVKTVNTIPAKSSEQKSTLSSKPLTNNKTPASSTYATTTTTKTSNKIINQSLKFKNTKSKASTNQVQKQQIKTNSKSKTQKQNDLLRLAALLKNQTNKSVINTTEKRLEAFLT